jgi:hypothetical protein
MPFLPMHGLKATPIEVKYKRVKEVVEIVATAGQMEVVAEPDN